MSQRQSGFSPTLRRVRRNGLLTLAAVALMCPASGLAQVQAAVGPSPAQATSNTGNGSVHGSVTDSTGAAVVGATITLRNVENGTDQTTTASATGTYQFPSVLPGSYVISVRMQGFSEGDTEPFAIAENVHQQVDVPLTAKGSSETVEVTAGGMSLQTDTSDRGQVMEQTDIQSLPLNGREYTDLALLNPGASSSQLQDDPIEPRRGSFHMNGMRSSVNNFLLDGIDNNSYQESNLGYNNQTITPSQDAIQQLKIITSNFPAEYGRSGGSILNTVSRSGTDRLHFSAWEYFRNTALVAYGPLYETGHKPQITQNQFGGTFGGPLVRDKLFYFANYEGYRINNNSYYISTLPNMNMRQGLFFGATGLATPITDPYTGTEYADGRVPVTDPYFWSNQFSQAILAALPVPTNNSEYYNFVTRSPGQNTRDLAELRLDWSLGARLRTFARYSQQVNHIVPGVGVPGPAGGYGDGHIYSVTNQVAMGATYAVTPASLLDVRLGITQVKSGKRPLNYGQTSYYTRFGIPYPVAPEAGTVALNTQSIGDITAFGTEPQTNIYENPFDIDLKPQYTMEHVRHTLGFGYELLVLKTPTAWQSPVYGEDIYDDHFSRTVAAPAGQLADYQEYYTADFIWGARSQYELSNYSRLTQNQRFHSLYAEDSWRILPKLTLNYGVRWELTVPDFESNNHLANYDPTTNALKLAHNGSYETRSMTTINWNNWAPRFGFAYAMLPRVVWRGGYGLSYIQFNRNADWALEYNGPYSITTVVQQLSPTNNMCSPGDQTISASDSACFRPTWQGYPSSMNSGIGFNTTLAESYYLPKHSPTGYVQDYYFGFQYQPDSHSILDVAYVGSHGVKVRVLTDYNWAPPESLGNIGSLADRRPIKNFADIRTALPAGFLKYNSLQVKFQERYKKLFIISSFTWSQARDNAGGDQEAQNGDTPIVNFLNIKGDAGISGYNQPLNSSTSVNWTLPRTGFRNHILRGILNDWRLNAINRVESGLPLNFYWGPSTGAYTTNVGYHYRPDYIGIGHKYQSVLNPKSQWVRLGGGQYVGNVLNLNHIGTPVNSYTTDQPITTSDGTTYTPSVLYGNMPRNSVRFVPVWQADASVFKDFRLGDHGVLQFRAEAYNVPNKTNWRTPTLSITSGAFGYIGSAMPSRQIAFGMKYTY